MKPINEVYTDEPWTWEKYQPMLDSFGYTILVQEDEDGYTGDSFLLMHDGSRYGYLQFGWGSCSACDALQMCNNLTEVAELRDELHNKIQWFPDAQTALQFMTTHDWQGDYCWWHDEVKRFIQRATDYLKAQTSAGAEER